MTLTTLLDAHVSDDPEAIGRSATTSALHALAAIDGEVVCDHCVGHASLLPKLCPLPGLAIFDLASVTKAIVPALLAMQAVEQGVLELDTQVRDWLPRWGSQAATLGQLLNHSSGLPSWVKYYEMPQYHMDLAPGALAAQRRHLLEQVAAAPKAPPGQVYAYSDLGYMALGQVLEKALLKPLDVLASERIFGPLGMRHTRYVNAIRGHTPIAHAVATEYCPHRGRMLQGEVHDENTALLGGVSGHAGVFGTAHDLLTLATHLLHIDHGLPLGRPALVSADTLHTFWDRGHIAQAPGAHHLLGWDTPSGPDTSAGRFMSPAHTVGHLGFTGTSIWIDRQANVVAILLTNRVHPSRDNPRIHALRVAFHEALLC